MDATATTHLVAVPYPGRGHVNSMLNFCDLLLSTNTTSPLTITFVVTEEWLSLLTPYLHPNINFHTIPNVIPSEHVRDAVYVAFLQAVDTNMKSPFETLISQLHLPPTSILADTCMPWVVSIAERRRIPIYSFFTMSASFLSLILPIRRELLPFASPFLLSSLYGSLLGNEISKYVLDAMERVKEAQGLVLATVYDLEASVVDALRAELPFKIYTVGPTIPFGRMGDDGGEYWSWLKTQPEGSVLYVSLGSFVTVSDMVIEALASGLRESGVRFLWAARGDSRRARELCGGKGMVVEWCVQHGVLCHSSVGAFLTHCGWNSVLEGVLAGKPMIGLPLRGDQRPNATLIEDEWKVGVKLENGVEKEEIVMGIRKVMDLDGDESEEMRKRSLKLMEKCRQAVGDGGSSKESLKNYMDVLNQK